MSEGGYLVNNIYINTKPNISYELACYLQSFHPNVPLDVIKFYAKTRINMRVKYINSTIREKNLKNQLHRYHITRQNQSASLTTTTSDQAQQQEVEIQFMKRTGSRGRGGETMCIPMSIKNAKFGVPLPNSIKYSLIFTCL